MDLVLRIRRKRKNEWFTLFVLAMPFCFGTLIEFLKFPTIIKYVIDIAWIFLLVTMIINKFKLPNEKARNLLNCVIAFFLITLIGFILNTQTPLYYLWGFRNYFRFFVFFFSCIMFLKEGTIDDVFRVFDKVFYINFVLALFQYFILGKEQDYLGGIFGVQTGSNAKTLIFFTIVITYSILKYINRKEKMSTCLVKCGMALIIAAFAELKFFYVLFVLIVVLATLITDFSIRKLVIVFFSIIGVFMGASLLMILFPDWSEWFNIENMFATAFSADGYTGRGDMNRLTGVSIARDMFLTTWPKKLFGLGLGNCDTSAFSFLNTPFYKRYGYLRYNWFSIVFAIMETGVIGTFCYILFFVLIYIYAWKNEKSGMGQEVYCQLARVMSIVSVTLLFYNSSMRIEEAYMMYFVLAIPFVRTKKKIV